jgi:hypothetical protein
MGKKSQRRRQAKAQRTRAGNLPRSPSPQTVFRMVLTSPDTRKMIEQTLGALEPQVLLRDQKTIRRIKDAKTADELLDLAPAATGLAESPWQERTREFGGTIVPLMAQRLKESASLRDEKERTLLVERIVAALRWHGKEGAEALQQSFSFLDLWGQSLASIVLGLLGAKESADLIWQYYEKVKDNRDNFLIGALWGLIDLQDERVGGALAALIAGGRRFYELYGFTALAGNAETIIPLGIVASDEARPKSEREDASMALVAVGHRIGRVALIAELGKAALPGETQEMFEKTADQILSYSPSDAEEYFDLFFHGFSPTRAIEAMGM